MKSHLRGKKKESCVSSTLPILALITSMCALPRSVNILCPHSHTHILGIQVMRLIALLQYWWTMEGFVSPCFIIKAASQGESQGDTREVERMTGKKKWNEPDIGYTVRTESGARLLPWPLWRQNNAPDSVTHCKKTWLILQKIMTWPTFKIGMKTPLNLYLIKQLSWLSRANKLDAKPHHLYPLVSAVILVWTLPDWKRAKLKTSQFEGRGSRVCQKIDAGDAEQLAWWMCCAISV